MSASPICPWYITYISLILGCLGHVPSDMRAPLLSNIHTLPETPVTPDHPLVPILQSMFPDSGCCWTAIQRVTGYGKKRSKKFRHHAFGHKTSEGVKDTQGEGERERPEGVKRRREGETPKRVVEIQRESAPEKRTRESRRERALEEERDMQSGPLPKRTPVPKSVPPTHKDATTLQTPFKHLETPLKRARPSARRRQRLATPRVAVHASPTHYTVPEIVRVVDRDMAPDSVLMEDEDLEPVVLPPICCGERCVKRLRQPRRVCMAAARMQASLTSDPVANETLKLDFFLGYIYDLEYDKYREGSKIGCFVGLSALGLSAHPEWYIARAKARQGIRVTPSGLRVTPRVVGTPLQKRRGDDRQRERVGMDEGERDEWVIQETPRASLRPYSEGRGEREGEGEEYDVVMNIPTSDSEGYHSAAGSPASPDTGSNTPPRDAVSSGLDTQYGEEDSGADMDMDMDMLMQDSPPPPEPQSVDEYVPTIDVETDPRAPILDGWERDPALQRELLEELDTMLHSCASPSLSTAEKARLRSSFISHCLTHESGSALSVDLVAALIDASPAEKVGIGREALVRGTSYPEDRVEALCRGLRRFEERCAIAGLSRVAKAERKSQFVVVWFCERSTGELLIPQKHVMKLLKCRPDVVRRGVTLAKESIRVDGVDVATIEESVDAGEGSEGTRPLSPVPPVVAPAPHVCEIVEEEPGSPSSDPDWLFEEKDTRPSTMYVSSPVQAAAVSSPTLRSETGIVPPASPTHGSPTPSPASISPRGSSPEHKLLSPQASVFVTGCVEGVDVVEVPSPNQKDDDGINVDGVETGASGVESGAAGDVDMSQQEDDSGDDTSDVSSSHTDSETDSETGEDSYSYTESETGLLSTLVSTPIGDDNPAALPTHITIQGSNQHPSGEVSGVVVDPSSSDVKSEGGDEEIEIGGEGAIVGEALSTNEGEGERERDGPKEEEAILLFSRLSSGEVVKNETELKGEAAGERETELKREVAMEREYEGEEHEEVISFGDSDIEGAERSLPPALVDVEREGEGDKHSPEDLLFPYDDSSEGEDSSSAAPPPLDDDIARAAGVDLLERPLQLAPPMTPPLVPLVAPDAPDALAHPDGSTAQPQDWFDVCAGEYRDDELSALGLALESFRARVEGGRLQDSARLTVTVEFIRKWFINTDGRLRIPSDVIERFMGCSSNTVRAAFSPSPSAYVSMGLATEGEPLFRSLEQRVKGIERVKGTHPEPVSRDQRLLEGYTNDMYASASEATEGVLEALANFRCFQSSEPSLVIRTAMRREFIERWFLDDSSSLRVSEDAVKKLTGCNITTVAKTILRHREHRLAIERDRERERHWLAKDTGGTPPVVSGGRRVVGREREREKEAAGVGRDGELPSRALYRMRGTISSQDFEVQCCPKGCLSRIPPTLRLHIIDEMERIQALGLGKAFLEPVVTMMYDPKDPCCYRALQSVTGASTNRVSKVRSRMDREERERRMKAVKAKHQTMIPRVVPNKGSSAKPQPTLESFEHKCCQRDCLRNTPLSTRHAILAELRRVDALPHPLPPGAKDRIISMMYNPEHPCCYESIQVITRTSNKRLAKVRKRLDDAVNGFETESEEEGGGAGTIPSKPRGTPTDVSEGDSVPSIPTRGLSCISARDCKVSRRAKLGLQTFSLSCCHNGCLKRTPVPRQHAILQEMFRIGSDPRPLDPGETHPHVAVVRLMYDPTHPCCHKSIFIITGATDSRIESLCTQVDRGLGRQERDTQLRHREPEQDTT
ncbi:hypothetical protein KIPB_005223 [Kipferlia bialata]|uniref:Uncharacterized protein n=1 Tax=Kipferlia bialata TaxID=797122 RepID=A0A9K3GH61_9EUKA|nr:hypothetical protein KIPB_005223 [Kipferlia bialata]|eukprot:g5223.t1